MSLRTRTQSIFRPGKAIDRSMLTANRTLVDDINRRNLLRGAVSLGALTMLTGCDVSENDSVQKALRAVSSWNDGVQARLFRPNHLAPTFSPAQVVKPPRFNAHFDIADVKPVDGATWKLELAGLIDDKRPWTAAQIDQLPQQELIIRHICVEGWDYIGQWSGVNLRSFLQRIGADLTAKYVYFHCVDDYTDEHRHGDRAASADYPRNQIRQRDHHRSVRLPAAAANLDEAWLQERQVDQGDGGHQRVHGNVLEQTGDSIGLPEYNS